MSPHEIVFTAALLITLIFGVIYVIYLNQYFERFDKKKHT